MADYHTVYKGDEGATTEWDDLQVKFGNKEAPEPKWKPDVYTPEKEERRGKELMDSLDHEDDLKELEDEFADDRFLEEYRNKRMQELKAAGKRPVFGNVEQIVRQEWVQKVTNAGEDVWVVVFLFKEGHGDCEVMSKCLDEVSKKHAGVRFVKIIATDAIPSYPDRNLPTLLVYNNTQVKKDFVTLAPFGGKRCTPEDVEFMLSQLDPKFFGAEEDELAAKLQRQYIERMIDRVEEERKKEMDDDDVTQDN